MQHWSTTFCHHLGVGSGGRKTAVDRRQNTTLTTSRFCYEKTRRKNRVTSSTWLYSVGMYLVPLQVVAPAAPPSSATTCAGVSLFRKPTSCCCRFALHSHTSHAHKTRTHLICSFGVVSAGQVTMNTSDGHPSFRLRDHMYTPALWIRFILSLLGDGRSIRRQWWFDPCGDGGFQLAAATRVCKGFFGCV